MPRQPFLPAYAHLDYAVGALVLNDRPALAAAIGRCIAIWGQADNEMGNLFGILLGTPSDAAMEVFLTLRRSSNQRDALRSAAKFRLTGDDLRFFEALMTVYASLERERNHLAHGCFGVASNDATVLLWVSIRDHVHFQTDVLARQARGDAVPDPHKRLKDAMYVYRTADLASLQSDMEQFWNGALTFNAYLRDPTGPHQAAALLQVRQQRLFNAGLAESAATKNGA